jgi:hypothetical protein
MEQLLSQSPAYTHMRDSNRLSCATSADMRQHFNTVKEKLFQACCSTMTLTACINALRAESFVFA